MGQAVRKLKPPPSRPVASPRASVPIVKSEAAGVQAAPPEARVVIGAEQNRAEEWGRPDSDLVSMSQRVVGSITTRKGGKQEHPSATISEDYTRPMPTDRHTTILSGPDEENIQLPGTLNYAHIRELFLLHQGQAESSEEFSISDLAKRFKVDPELLRQVLHHTRLVHASTLASHEVTPLGDTASQRIAETVQHVKNQERFEVKKQPF